MLRLAQDRQLAPSEASELLSQLVMPHPDITLPLHALMSRTRAASELLQVRAPMQGSACACR